MNKARDLYIGRRPSSTPNTPFEMIRLVLFSLALYLLQVGAATFKIQEECPHIEYCYCLEDVHGAMETYESIHDRYFEKIGYIRDSFEEELEPIAQKMNASRCDDPIFKQTALEYVYHVLHLCGGYALRDNYQPIWKQAHKTNEEVCVYIATRLPLMCKWVNINYPIIESCEKRGVFDKYVYKPWEQCESECF